jgi:hypothetical protein
MNDRPGAGTPNPGTLDFAFSFSVVRKVEG